MKSTSKVDQPEPWHLSMFAAFVSITIISVGMGLYYRSMDFGHLVGAYLMGVGIGSAIGYMWMRWHGAILVGMVFGLLGLVLVGSFRTGFE